ncbi:hypothetical protein M378DRAFT_166490 [Amanita muscaria Koide BX008]|uniref:Uncharacterized protein n=1 Tax=Amanita muscaria (strain Koide BX008) TaxID=946122 RepID=A0A0C2SF73_AMAMK|nr:hypothetical protein M378DRAFT_166490 [Amanita muscaria Koide BX008]
MPDGLAVGMEGRTLTPTTAWPGTASNNNVRHKRRERRYDGQVFGRMLDSIRSSLLQLSLPVKVEGLLHLALLSYLVDDISSLSRVGWSATPERVVAPSPRGGEEREEG